MKFIIAPLVLIASLGLSHADPVDRAPPSQASSVTTEYPALHSFHHTVGETSFVGYYFNGKPVELFRAHMVKIGQRGVG